MTAGYAESETPDGVVGRFLCEYYNIWQKHFPGLNKRAHWHVVFSARTNADQGVSCRSIHRTLYGFYGTDIRTCIERVKDCEADGFIKVQDASNRPCAASPGCFVVATGKLYDRFDQHARDTIDELSAAFAGREHCRAAAAECNDAAIAAIFSFLGAHDQKWRETCEFVVRQKKLTPAHFNDAMDHLVTYQYWAIVMLLWRASRFFGSENASSPALVIDEINSRMWDVLRLGHLAIKERVENLIRWGFFAEQTIKKRKAVALTQVAGAAISKSLADTKPLLQDLYTKLVQQPADVVAARSA
jgi:hypothetical protein